jgi:hypothetical protein
MMRQVAHLGRISRLTLGLRVLFLHCFGKRAQSQSRTKRDKANMPKRPEEAMPSNELSPDGAAALAGAAFHDGGSRRE